MFTTTYAASNKGTSLDVISAPIKASSTSRQLASVQDLLEWVSNDVSLGVQKRRNEMAAIKWLGRVDKTPLAAIPLTSRCLVSDRFPRIRAFHDLQPERRSAIVSLLNGVLKRAGILLIGARRGGELSVDWCALLEALPCGDMRKALSTFAHFCSARSVAPDGVTLQVWQDFTEETLNHSAFKKPRETIHRVARSSNRARGSLPNWPIPELPRLANPRIFRLPSAQLPESFSEDLEAYVHASSKRSEDIFDTSSAKHLAKATLARYRDQLWRTASAQVHSGRSAAEIVSLAALLDPAWLKKAMAWTHARAGHRFLKDHLNMAATWLSVADNWVRPPEELRGQIRTEIFDVINKNLGPASFSQRNLRRLDQFDDPNVIERFLHFPCTVWNEARSKKRLSIEDAAGMTAAVAVEILLSTMMRRKNLVELDLSKNFWPYKPTLKDGWTIRIDAPDVKNKQFLNFPLRLQTVRLIRFYLDRCRPLLQKQKSDRLFFGHGGEPMTGQAMYHLIVSTVRRRLGIELTVHLFRHIGAMLFLEANPGQLEVVRIMLGHTSTKTTERFYATMKQTAAVRHFTDAVLAGRKDALLLNRTDRR